MRTQPIGCMCGCDFRRFLSADEEIELLEQYKGHLQREIAGVDIRIGELKKEGTE
jgi:hypothetical protein